MCNIIRHYRKYLFLYYILLMQQIQVLNCEHWVSFAKISVNPLEIITLLWYNY